MLDRVKSIREALSRTRQATFGRVATLLGATTITPELWDELEALLLQADVGTETTLAVLTRAKDRVAQAGITRADGLKTILKSELRALIFDAPPLDLHIFKAVRVVLIVGTNGSGKTTTIAKLAAWYKAYGRSVLLAAGDTFRAAAGDQLEVWADRVGVPVIGGQPGSDPGAVVFDALQAARSREVNIVLVDTAGRLHTKFNLMQELKKVRNVITKAIPGAPHETWLVLDGTTGQNALMQAQQFKAAVAVTGIIITKLDGTAKGGMVFAVSHELGLPIRFIGTGETMIDITPFDADVFVDGLLE
ncbi:MAG TPA: signal recognition particle-docking protein FtsY [Anaerolineae bacterium]|nr:signal recognition particle-docking protein FtsY [Anaerolineae bacterium]